MLGSEASADNSTNKRSSDELGANDDNGTKRPRTAHVNTNPSKVIHIRNVPLEATEGELYTLCAPFGKVVTAVIMKGKAQALVQMQDQAGATALVEFYDKNTAMLRTNLIHLQYSTREELTNKPPMQMPGAATINPSVLPSRPNTQPPPPGSQSESRNEACVLLVNVSNVTYPITIELLHSVFAKYGLVTKIVIFNKKGIQAFVQFATSAAAELAKNALDGQNIYVGCCTLRVNFATVKDLDVKYNNDKSRDFLNPYLLPQTTPLPPSAPSPMWNYMPDMKNPVVIVSGLNEEEITPDTLFTLFGVYGDVLKVKILFTKKDTALVQMATSWQAESVITHLNMAVVQGKTIRINTSKHCDIMSSTSNSTDENPLYTKEYVGSPLHRFKSPNNPFKHICPPSATLHIIPASVNEADLRALFSERGGEVVNVKFFPSEKRMALVQMASIPAATSILISFHNFRFENSQIPIRISFAKSAIYS